MMAKLKEKSWNIIGEYGHLGNYGVSRNDPLTDQIDFSDINNLL